VGHIFLLNQLTYLKNHLFFVGLVNYQSWYLSYDVSMLRFLLPLFLLKLSFSSDWFEVLVPSSVSFVFLRCYIFFSSEKQNMSFSMDLLRLSQKNLMDFLLAIACCSQKWIIIINLCLWNMSSLHHTHVWTGLWLKCRYLLLKPEPCKWSIKFFFSLPNY